MGKELKIVLIVLAVYLVIGLQNVSSVGVFITPYELNPLIIFVVAVISFLLRLKDSFDNNMQVNYSVNGWYLVAISFYALLASRSLHLFYNQSKVQFFIDISNNIFTPLISILGFYSVLIFIVWRGRLKIKKIQVPLLLLIFSMVGTLFNVELLQIICFTIFVLSLVFTLRLTSDEKLKDRFSSIVYQLVMFMVIENIYFIITKY